jgi:hypothetical protein
MAVARLVVIYVACILAAAVSARLHVVNVIDSRPLVPAVGHTHTVASPTPSLVSVPASAIAARASQSSGGGDDVHISHLRQAILHANTQRKVATDKLVQAYDNARCCWLILPSPATLE